MHLNYSHKPNYYFYAQRFMHFIKQKLTQQEDLSPHAIFSLSEIYSVFSQDFAATTVNLEGILNIAQDYYIAEDPSQTLITAQHINAEQNTLELQLDPTSLKALKLGASLNAPDAAG